MVKVGSGAQVDKFCKDCKYIENEWFGNMCIRYPKYTNPVTSISSYSYEAHCGEQRSMPIILDLLTGSCGKRGRFWEKNNAL